MHFPPIPVRPTGRAAFTWRHGGPLWFHMTPDPELVFEARRFTRRLLAAYDEGLIDDAELVTSELVTNALQHALTVGDPPGHVVPDICLGVQPLERYVRVCVRDPYPVAPVRKATAETDTSGRGLFIVEALTAVHWVDARTYDKTVHAIVCEPGVTLTEDELDRLRS